MKTAWRSRKPRGTRVSGPVEVMVTQFYKCVKKQRIICITWVNRVAGELGLHTV